MEGRRRTQKYDNETMKQCQVPMSYFCRWMLSIDGMALGTSVENELGETWLVLCGAHHNVV